MRERKKELIGRVVSDRMDKTVVVAVNSLRRHRLYQRTMRRTKKYMAHDADNTCRIGDLVRIQEGRPESRHKHWRVVGVLEQAALRGKAVEMPAGMTTADAVDVPNLAGAAATPDNPPGDAGAAE